MHIAGKKVVLSVGDAPRVARNYRGKDVVEWLEEMGYYNIPIENHPAGESAKHKTNHYVTGRDGGRDIDLRQRAIEGMQLRGMLSSMEDKTISFKPDLEQNLDNADATYNRIQKKIDDYITENGIEASIEEAYEAVWRPESKGDETIDIIEDSIEAVIWSTGFRVDFSWADFPIYDEKGYPKYKRGITSEKGLYFLGLPWLHTWGSGRFSHVADDAEYIAEHALTFLQATTV